MLGPSTFRFLGEELELRTASDWNDPLRPKLWLYNSHYFDDLVATNAAGRSAWQAELIKRWQSENPPGQGNGWEPYPSSLRIVNWIKWGLTGNELTASARHSLAVQTRFLRRRLEIHLLGNHLWANVKALVFAGCFFEGEEADLWRAKGMALIRRELIEQVMADGGHFERSPMYHAILLEDVLDLIQLASVYPGTIHEEAVSAWREAAARMLHWLEVMTHPDGGIGFFNDATLGIAPDLETLVAYAATLGIDPVTSSPGKAIRALPDTGYVRLQAGPVVMLADVGEVGPDYLPGHAHADTLSFELSIDGQRVLVNSGISTYEADAERSRQRGTAAHNTVEVDGQDSSEVWSSFRVARRARPLEVDWNLQGEVRHLRGGHDGYRRLPGRPIHRRAWNLAPDGLEVIDRIDGRWNHVVARFMLHPAWQLRLEPYATEGWITRASRRIVWACEGAGRVRMVPGSWHPGFGRTEHCQVLEIELAGPALTTRFSWV